ncbi:hypothetical protein BST92_11410 [Nonlabens arenilitoris]|uniref:Calx-beta domain-containing protein n=1 Tax=Nonlabens arenilitoris TaxID=1217969 RepID=A0A2S7UC25_9FLAO|nr:Calx-beta domain-containing protein [Nonlabens arenilitoris]PQJ32498.1 hypothetical protein BST92_11410 [Nonlabens arenilitoris]
MKVLRIILLCLFAFNYAYAQVGIGTETPDPAAILDVRSEISPGVYGGLKLPTLTLAQRATITAPIPDGLMIYLSDGNNRCLQIYDGTRSQWMDWYCMNELPEASLVDYTGILEVDENLSASYTYTDGENDTESGTSYQWYRADDASGTNVIAISGATAATYLTTTADGNFYVAVGVTPRASTGASPGIEVLSPYREIKFKQTEIEFAVASSTIPENDFSTININVLNPSPTVATTVEVNLNAASTAGVLGTDYDIDDNNSVAVTAFPFTMTIPAGATTASFVVYAYADDNNAVDEILQLDLQNPSGGINPIIGAVGSHSVTFIDDDSATEIAFDSITYSEVENGLVGSIDINIINPSTITATTVEVALNASSTATNGVDYDTDAIGTALTFPITVTFPANTSASQQIDFFITNDLISEGDETIVLDLQNVSGGISTIIGANASTTFNIVDDEVPLFTEMNQDFDSSVNWNYTLSPSAYNVSDDVWNIVNSMTSISTLNGNFWGMRDLNNSNGGGNFLHTLTFDDVDISGGTNVIFTFDYESQDLNAASDRYGYELYYDGVGQGQQNICAGCDTDLNGTITINIPNTVTTFGVVMYGRFDGGSDLAAFDNFRLYQ